MSAVFWMALSAVIGFFGMRQLSAWAETAPDRPRPQPPEEDES